MVRLAEWLREQRDQRPVSRLILKKPAHMEELVNKEYKKERWRMDGWVGGWRDG